MGRSRTVSGKSLVVEDLAEKISTRSPGSVVDPAADAPEIADGGDVFAAGHDALEGVGQERLGRRCRALEGLLQDRVGHVFGGAGGDRGLDQDQAVGLDLLADDLQAVLQGGHVGLAVAAVSQSLLEIVALDVHDDHVGKAEGVVGEGGRQGLFSPSTQRAIIGSPPRGLRP